jgi:hypothetical protein
MKPFVSRTGTIASSFRAAGPTTGSCPVPDPERWYNSSNNSYFYAANDFNGSLTANSYNGGQYYAFDIVNDGTTFGRSTNGFPTYAEFPDTFKPTKIVVVFQITENSFFFDEWSLLTVIAEPGNFLDSFQAVTVSRTDLEAQGGGLLNQTDCYKVTLDNISYPEGQHMAFLDFQASYGKIKLRDVEFYNFLSRIYPA